MRSTRAYLMIAFSVLAGIVAVVFGARWLALQASMSTHQVVVAARDVELGTPLNSTMLQLVRWPSGSVPHGAISDPAALESRVIIANVQRGEPVLEAKLAPIGTKGGLSAVIGEGKRAITVKVNEVVGVAGFALPGNHVDVLVNIRDDRDTSVSKIVLENILVLAIAQEAGRDDTKPKVVNAVTLEATPEQAEKLDLARSIGTLSLVLRNQIDKKPVTTAGIRKEDLLALKAKTAPPPPRPVRHVAPVAKADKVEMIRGVQKSNVEF